MKQFILLTSLIGMLMAPVRAQISVMFVDDSEDTFGNAELFASSLDSLGISYLYFNALDSAASPADTLMAKYDLVIWHTSNVGSGGPLWLWNQLDEDNANIVSYLNGGGNLWLVGLDFLFDRYNTAADTFAAGDFPYDYLGVSSYDVQTYADDGSLGVPFVYADTASAIEGLDTLSWIFSTMWYADGVTPVAEASTIYRMGDASYVFAEKPIGILYDADTFETLTFFFDLALAADFSMIKNTTSAVIDYFSTVDSTTSIQDFPATAFTLFPNPATNHLSMEVVLPFAEIGTVKLVNLQGQVVEVLLADQKLSAGAHRFDWTLNESLPDGLYVLQFNLGTHSTAKLVQVSK
ncbi:MAG: T9SS type A sorting domain-containing protein [Bacteroidia bacterium]|nr:T9SS type A sorting domain-containing protein [Bacteroidia bacterium]